MFFKVTLVFGEVTGRIAITTLTIVSVKVPTVFRVSVNRQDIASFFSVGFCQKVLISKICVSEISIIGCVGLKATNYSTENVSP